MLNLRETFSTLFKNLKRTAMVFYCIKSLSMALILESGGLVLFMGPILLSL
jgi:hypothetical protein